MRRCIGSWARETSGFIPMCTDPCLIRPPSTLESESPSIVYRSLFVMGGISQYQINPSAILATEVPLLRESYVQHSLNLLNRSVR